MVRRRMVGDVRAKMRRRRCEVLHSQGRGSGGISDLTGLSQLSHRRALHPSGDGDRFLELRFAARTRVFWTTT